MYEEKENEKNVERDDEKEKEGKQLVPWWETEPPNNTWETESWSTITLKEEGKIIPHVKPQQWNWTIAKRLRTNGNRVNNIHFNI